MVEPVTSDERITEAEWSTAWGLLHVAARKIYELAEKDGAEVEVSWKFRPRVDKKQDKAK